MTREIDEGFIGRVYGASAVVWAVGVALWWGTLGWRAAAGWTAGSALSIGVLRGFEWIVRRSFRPGAVSARRDFMRFSLAKLPIILVALTAVVFIGGKSLPVIAAFCAGIALTQTVIVLKAIGMMILKRS